jgi:hypothetical protein
MDYTNLCLGTLLRADTDAGRYTAVRIKDGWLAVKVAGAVAHKTFATAEDWMAQIPGSPEIRVTGPHYDSKTTMQPIKKRTEDIQRLADLMRTYKIKKAVHINNYSTNEMIQYLRERDAGTPGLESRIMAFKNKAAVEGPETAARRYGEVYGAQRLFVVNGGDLSPITVAQTKMAGNFPYEYEKQDVIVYGGRVGKTFAEVGLDSPFWTLWHINRDGVTTQVDV